MADYADADPAVVKSGRMKKAVTNAVEKEGTFSYSEVLPSESVINDSSPPVKLLCGLEASQGAVEEVVSSAASVEADAPDSSDDLDHEEDCGGRLGRKKKNKRRKGTPSRICSSSSECKPSMLVFYGTLSPQKARAVMGRSIRWTFGWCSPPTFVQKMCAGLPSSVGAPG